MTSIPQDVRELMAEWTVIDGHGHTLDQAYHRGLHLDQPLGGTTDVPQLKEGGVHAQLTATWTPDGRLSGPHAHSVDNPLLAALRMFDYLYREVAGSAGAASHSSSPPVTSCAPRRRGADRRVQSAGHSGVDLTHLVEAAFYPALAASRRPVIVSHAGARALTNTPRYLSNRQIAAVAQQGGVVCASPSPLGPTDERPGLEMLLAAIEHFVDLVGPEHVGIATDSKDQLGYYPPPLTDVSQTPVIAQSLLARGHQPDVVGKIMGGNVLRVIGEAIG